ncbi:MAG: c-type cytochrome [Polyangiaceae bacterium]|nr:c-type cytochrome [Polyangiaceae bacterium]
MPLPPVRRLASPGAVTTAILLGALALQQVPRAAHAQDTTLGVARLPESGEALFLQTCASCHGADGRGAPRSEVGFDLPLPDFTDCSFGSREPHRDWLAVAHRGGPARGFDATMPSFEGARTDAELERIVAHVKSFCPERRWPQGELNLPRAQVTSKAYVEDEVVVAASAALEGPTDVAGKLIYGARLGARYQLEASLPFGFREVEPDEPGVAGRWAEGAGDVGFGLKRVLVHSARSGSILTLATEVFLPTGDATDGYGRDTVMIEPFLSAGQIVAGTGFVQFQGGFELPIETHLAEREVFGRVAVGNSYRPRPWGRAWSPMVELAASRALESGATTHWDFIPELQVSLSTRQHILANVGVRLPMTELDARPTELLFYLLWDWYDGGALEGW